MGAPLTCHLVLAQLSDMCQAACCASGRSELTHHAQPSRSIVDSGSIRAGTTKARGAGKQHLAGWSSARTTTGCQQSISGVGHGHGIRCREHSGSGPPGTLQAWVFRAPRQRNGHVGREGGRPQGEEFVAWCTGAHLTWKAACQAWPRHGPCMRQTWHQTWHAAGQVCHHLAEAPHTVPRETKPTWAAAKPSHHLGCTCCQALCTCEALVVRLALPPPLDVESRSELGENIAGHQHLMPLGMPREKGRRSSWPTCEEAQHLGPACHQAAAGAPTLTRDGPRSAKFASSRGAGGFVGG